MSRLRYVLPALLAVLTAGRLSAQGFSPEEAVKRMKVPDGFQVKLVAAEPEIRQPVTMTFDDRGRLWVIQYLQYPTPAGLKPVKVDQYLRTTYDRTPEPPPKGPKGADRITILSDPDANGRYRKAKDFVGGLNLATGLALGHGGAFVLQAPYLLFYPDRDGDDVPDGPPEVLLQGFGLEDAHALANSLQWGPDGWLYGAQGSTVTARIRNPARPTDPPIEFQQGIWRYHPRTKEFELFAEGGGNTWGLDFDARGQIIAGTNWGGFAMLHQVQGGYYIKGFSKHGPLHNPHTYGYFDHVPYRDFQGGHVTCGGIVYQGGAYPEQYRGAYIAGNLLSNLLHWHVLERKGSSFTARRGGDFLVAHDTWFRPIDCLTGPDGSVYVADWYDRRANHVDPVDNWDRSNGRIYKVEYKGTKPVGKLALGKLPSHELVALLGHPNAWYSGEARRLLAERRDPAVVPGLRAAARTKRGRPALESLWALYVSGGFDDATAAQLLGHADEDVRAWAVRFLGDARKVSPALRERLVELARAEPSPVVRSQLACSCKRLPAADGLPVVRALLRHGEDVSDPTIPLLLWWAVEDKAVSHRDAVLALLDVPEAWQAPLVKGFLVERLARRYASEDSPADWRACARLLTAAPTSAGAALVLRGIDLATESRRLTRLPAELRDDILGRWRKQPSDLTLLRLAVRLDSADAYRHAIRRAADPKVPEGQRVPVVGLLAEAGRPDCAEALKGVLEKGKSDNLRAAALDALAPFADRDLTERLLALYPRMSSRLRGRALALLCSRPESALALLKAVDAGGIAAREVPLEQVRRVAAYKDETARKLVAKHWGSVTPATPGEKVARIRSVLHILNLGKGDPGNGRVLFQKHCATCHTLFGEGNKVGPDLTTADRKNREYLVTQVVDPSAIIRAEYQSFTVETKDGRSLTGLVVESNAGTVTLVDGKNERTVVPRTRIEQMAPSPVSLMPEKILDPLTDQEICDLFRYLQGDGPKVGKRH